jgi:acylphosphatase
MDDASQRILTCRIVVHGRVQGVGFRQFTAQKARQYHVRGQVRNLPDGTVECIAQADEASMKRFLTDLKRGPLLSKVDRVVIEELPSKELQDFHIAYQ